jgi:hypothetical protein
MTLFRGNIPWSKQRNVNGFEGVMWYRVAWELFTDISEECAASTFMVEGHCSVLNT